MDATIKKIRYWRSGTLHKVTHCRPGLCTRYRKSAGSVRVGGCVTLRNSSPRRPRAASMGKARRWSQLGPSLNTTNARRGVALVRATALFHRLWQTLYSPDFRMLVESTRRLRKPGPPSPAHRRSREGLEIRYGCELGTSETLACCARWTRLGVRMFDLHAVGQQSHDAADDRRGEHGHRHARATDTNE